MKSLRELIVEARQTRKRYDEVLGHSIDVPANELASQLVEHIEKQMMYELELTQKIMKLEEENAKLKEKLSHKQDVVDSMS
jgi:uncharacterized protein YceH (UPF0502 family)